MFTKVQILSELVDEATLADVPKLVADEAEARELGLQVLTPRQFKERDYAGKDAGARMLRRTNIWRNRQAALDRGEIT